MVLPLMTAPFDDGLMPSKAPTVVTPELLLPLVRANQPLPFQIKEADEPGLKVSLPIVKLLLPTLFIYMIRPDVVTVGLGIVKLKLLAVVVTSNVVATSTVLACVPIGPLAASDNGSE